MSGFLNFDELVDVLTTESSRLVDEAQRVLPQDPVPTCPGWTVQDLLLHIGGVHRWAATIVSEAHTENLSTEHEAAVMAGPADTTELTAWFKEGTGRLVGSLQAAPADLRAFVFLKNAPAPRLFWARREAHETTIHRVDALASRLGRIPSTHEAAITAEVALDGIDELLTGFVPRRSSRLRTDEPFSMMVAPTDADVAWTVAVSDQPPVVTRTADPYAQGVLSGTAAALYLGLWNRGDDIAENGTVDALGHWREQVQVSWA
jgi:uncharacterized protein (TIGR03083 family)